MRFLYITLIFSFLGVNTHAQKPKIKYINTNITIDGKIDETVWGQLEENTNFYNYLPTDIGLAANQTSVKMFHNKEYLFVSAIYYDTTEKTTVSTLKRDTSIFLSDAFVMILDTQNQEQNGYFFAVNSLGNQTDGLVGRNNDGYNLSFSWSAVWQSATFLNGKQKQYEIAIPFFETALAINNNLNDKNYRADILFKLGEVYSKLNRYSEAEDYLNRSLQATKAKDIREKVYFELALINEEKGNYKSAYKYRTLSSKFSDSLKNERYIKQINLLEKLVIPLN